MSYAECDRQITVYRQTAYAVQPAAVGVTLSLYAQPRIPARVQIELSDATSDGVVRVTGATAGLTGVVEDLTFESGGARTTVRSWDSITSITTAGLTSEAVPPTVTGTYVGGDGSPIPRFVALVADRVAAIWESGNRAWSGNGTAAVSPSAALGGYTVRGWIPYESSWAPRAGDLIVESNGTQWLVQGAPVAPGTIAPDGWRLTLTQRQGSI